MSAYTVIFLYGSAIDSGKDYLSQGSAKSRRHLNCAFDTIGICLQPKSWQSTMQPKCFDPPKQLA